MAPTYARAMENFVLNPQISSSILSHNYGLGQEGREIMVPYSFDQKGSVGIQGTSGDLKRFDSMEKMRIIPVEDALKELFSKKDKELIIKCDCEGAEYEIIESLIKNDLISKVSVILMEWHLFDGHEKFERMMAQLEKSGFVIHTSPNGRNRRVGMLYGCNHNVCKEHSSS
jgi:FkbM family methyltransferase